MAEYGILLVDDEEEVRSAILKKIDWKGLGFGQIHDAENGRDALEKIELYKPDVLLTDIRMPFMDGLKLCEQVRKKYPYMKLLIFSGFDDFDYAKQAIKLNVSEYILKPVNVEELSEILRRMKENLDEEIRQRRDVAKLRGAFESSLPLVQEAFLNRMLQGSFSESELESALEQYRIDLSGARKWDIAIAYPEKKPEGEHEKDLIALRAFLWESLKEYYRCSVFPTADGICVICAIDEWNTKTDLLELLNELSKECAKMLEEQVTIGVGHSSKALTELSVYYPSALEALVFGREKHPGNAIYINDILLDRDNASAKIVATAQKYIQAHFMEPELSANEVCRYLHVSPNYFSTIFKKETGQTYVGYLTQVRLEKAVELLEHTADKTYVIAEKTGYLDQNYFSYVFKKKYGISPTRYRKNLEENH